MPDPEVKVACYGNRRHHVSSTVLKLNGQVNNYSSGSDSSNNNKKMEKYSKF